MGRTLRGGEWPPPAHLQHIGHGARAVRKGRLSFSRTSGYDGGSGGGLPCLGEQQREPLGQRVVLLLLREVQGWDDRAHRKSGRLCLRSVSKRHLLMDLQ